MLSCCYEQINFEDLIRGENKIFQIFLSTVLNFCFPNYRIVFWFYIFILYTCVFGKIPMISWSFYCPFNKRINHSMKKSIVSRLDIDINCKDSDDKALVLLSAGKSNYSGELLLNSGTGLNSERTTLYKSMKLGHKYFMHILVKWKVNINELNGFDNKTALHLFIQRGYEDIAYILLAAGADVNLADKRGETALHYAARNGSEQLVKSLLERGADITRISDSGKTVLHYTAGYGKNDIVVLLLEAGASADIRDKGGRTALLGAVLFECMKATLTLQKCTDNLDAGDQYKYTALHYSSQNDFTEVVKTLLEAGANVDSMGLSEITPLCCSVWNKKIDVMKELFQHGANLDIGDDSGQTALVMAILASNYEAVAILIQHGDKSSKENKEKIHAVLECLKNKTEFKPMLADNVTPVVSVKTNPSTDTAPSKDTSPIAYTTTPFERVETIPTTATTSTDTTPIMCTTTTPLASTNTTKLPTSSTTTSTNAFQTTQLKQPQKSTHKIYKSYQKYNLTETKREPFGKNGQTSLEKQEETSDDSYSGQENLSRLGQSKDKQDVMTKEEKTIVRSSRIINRKKIFGKLIRTRASDDRNNQKKKMTNNVSIEKAKTDRYKHLRYGSADFFKCSSEHVRKRIRTRTHHRANRLSCRRKYFWTHNAYAKKRMKKTTVKCMNRGLGNSTKPDTLDGNDIAVGNKTKQTTMKYLTQMGVSLPVLAVLNLLQSAINIKGNSRKQITSRTGKTTVNVNLNYISNVIRDCNEVNIENVNYLTIDGKFGGKDG